MGGRGAGDVAVAVAVAVGLSGGGGVPVVVERLTSGRVGLGGAARAGDFGGLR